MFWGKYEAWAWCSGPGAGPLGADEEACLLLVLKKNICLTGFMGSGKTSVGQILARMLGVNFWDSDAMLVQKLGMSIKAIFKCAGEEFFRDRETEMLAFLGRKSPGSCVIATGGGAVLRAENLAALRSNGVIVYLDVTAVEACRRLKGTDERPLLQGVDFQYSPYLISYQL